MGSLAYLRSTCQASHGSSLYVGSATSAPQAHTLRHQKGTLIVVGFVKNIKKKYNTLL